MKTRSAFTLLEVLIVVAIIALLVAILVPSLQKAREQGRRMTCQAQLRQLGLSWHQYLNENKGFFVQDKTGFIKNADINYGGQQGTSASFRVSKPLNKQIPLPLKATRGAEIFQCPGDTASPSDFAWYGTSYRSNRMLIGQGSLQLASNDRCAQSPPDPSPLERVSKRLKALNLSKVSADHARLLLMGDFEWDTTYQPAWTLYGPDWHGQRFRYNMVFLDGHADFVEVHKGVHTSGQYRYTTVPFQDLQGIICDCQEEMPCQ